MGVSLSLHNRCYHTFAEFRADGSSDEETKSILLRARHSKTVGVQTISTFESILSSVIAGSVTTIATNPLWLIQTRQATKRASKRDEVRQCCPTGKLSK
jgi:hypothetical protein